MERVRQTAGVVLVALLTVASRTAATWTNCDGIFADEECGGTPVVMVLTETSSPCSTQTCTAMSFGNETYYHQQTCTSKNRYTFAEDEFDGIPYVMYGMFDHTDCDTDSYTYSYVYWAAESCQPTSGLLNNYNGSITTTLYDNGTVEFNDFRDDACTSLSSKRTTTSQDVSNHTCASGTKFYTSMNSWASSSDSASGSSDASSTSAVDNRSTFGSSSSSTYNSGSSSSSSSSDLASELHEVSGISSGAIAGIVAGCIATTIIVAVLLLRWRRSQFKRANHDGEVGLWGDAAITAVRVPREKVIVQQLISRGGYGEVLFGTFNSQPVAIKMLLPDKRKNIHSVNELLSEVKLMATMDHPRIVQLVGVAWDSLVDMCVVLEYMEGGDLRGLLDEYAQQELPVGFNRDKVKIALHVAHALTYLHSLVPPVIHRDLKSKNILLSRELDAKLTDFGISRERAEQTMTAGVGTSLWMAPEVMLGQQYGDKADVFSFGVVLSELDSHLLPYAHETEKGRSGKKMPDTAILQMVATGDLRVEFSDAGPQSMVELGLACVSVDPNQRPTAAEVLCKLQGILAHEL